MKITQAEYNKMVEELLGREEVIYDMLFLITKKNIKPKVAYWCRNDAALRGRGYEEDIMQNIYIRLMNTTITMFLLRDEAGGKVNSNPDEFCKWLCTLAHNAKIDFAKRIYRTDNKQSEMTDDIADNSDNSLEITEEHRQKLKESFSIALASDFRVYKVLTWIAQFVFILSADLTKIESNWFIVKAFENKILNEMYKIILDATKKIPWLQVSVAEDKKIRDDLNEFWDKERTYGEIQYKEFFMKKGSIESVSDWSNRMNKYIMGRMKNGASDN